MCYVSAIGAAVSVGSGMVGNVLSTKASAKAAKQNAQNTMMQYGTEVANLNIQAIDTAVQGRQQMTQAEFERFQTMGSLNATLNESMIGGNTAGRLKRMTSAQFERQKADFNASLDMDFANIYNQQIGAKLNTEAKLQSIKSSVPSRRAQLFGHLGTIGTAAATFGPSIYKEMKSK